MSIREEFLKSAKQLVGLQRPKGVTVVNWEGGVLLTYNSCSEEQREWVYSCEEKLGGQFAIWVSVHGTSMQCSIAKSQGLQKDGTQK